MTGLPFTASRRSELFLGGLVLSVRAPPGSIHWSDGAWYRARGWWAAARQTKTYMPVARQNPVRWRPKAAAKLRHTPDSHGVRVYQWPDTGRTVRN
jgi:hypothetical protein